MLAHDKLSVIVATVILCAVLYLFFTKTRLGTAMRATSENMLAAYYMGIPVKRVVSLIWAISAAVAACAGVLLAPITFVHSNVGLALALKAFPAAVLGGFGSIPGALVGGIIIGVIETMAGFYLPQGWKDVAPYIVLLPVLLLKPEGPVRPRSAGRRSEGLMRFIFKTDYDQDIRILKHGGHWWSYGVLLAVLAAAPFCSAATCRASWCSCSSTRSSASR